MLVAEARRVLLGTLQRPGAGPPNEDAPPHESAADRLGELREWAASALCHLRYGHSTVLFADRRSQ